MRESSDQVCLPGVLIHKAPVRLGKAAVVKNLTQTPNVGMK